MSEEKARPPRHTGEDDVTLDRHLRRKYGMDYEPTSDAHIDDEAAERDLDVMHLRGQTGPSENGQSPGEMHVARPEDYRDPWNPLLNKSDKAKGKRKD
jgi:hypothetical protein